MILCAIVLAAVIKATAAVSEVERIDEKVKTQTFFIKSLTIDTDTLVARDKSEAVKAECKKVYETIRYQLARYSNHQTFQVSPFADRSALRASYRDDQQYSPSTALFPYRDFDNLCWGRCFHKTIPQE